jgi:hypothetical protein
VNAPVKHILGTAHDLAKWRGQVDRALRGQPVGFEQVADAIDEGRMFMFDSGEAFVVIEPQGDPIQLVVVVGGGSQKGLEGLELVVSVWGSIIGAKKIVAHAREGFWRRLKKQGWKKSRIVIEKEICHGWR